jgi:hypothetical protein
MVINPAYYTHASNSSRQHSLSVHAASQQYLFRVDHCIDENFMQPSLGPHQIWLSERNQMVQVDRRSVDNFEYPLKNDVEWALEFARLVEKFLRRNSQGFTTNLDQQGQLQAQGHDFASYDNYSWNPELPGLSKGLQMYHSRRRSHFIERNREVRDYVVSALKGA